MIVESSGKRPECVSKLAVSCALNRREEEKFGSVEDPPPNSSVKDLGQHHAVSIRCGESERDGGTRRGRPWPRLPALNRSKGAPAACCSHSVAAVSLAPRPAHVEERGASKETAGE
jgi:hypothetical protein